jgi:hypothetical protein
MDMHVRQIIIKFVGCEMRRDLQEERFHHFLFILIVEAMMI